MPCGKKMKMLNKPEKVKGPKAPKKSDLSKSLSKLYKGKK